MDYTSFAPGKTSKSAFPPPSISPEPRRSFTPKFIAVIFLLLMIGAAAYAGIQYWQDQLIGEDYAPVFTPRASINSGQFCGGIATGAFPCPSGYSCKLNGTYPDAGGTCVKQGMICAQVITRAKNIQTGETKDFPTPCDVPTGWQKI